jgi:tetratricopeptide (TPR) repeat protein
VGVALTELGFTLFRAGKPEQALERLTRAVQILSLTQTANHRSIARAKYYMARPLARLGRHDEALRVLGEARAAYVSEVGELSAPVERMDSLIGNELLITARYAEARALYARTLERHLAGPEIEQAFVALLHDDLGEVALAEGRFELALSECTEAIRIHEQHKLDDPANLVFPLECAGRAQLALGHAAVARELLARALRLRERTCSPLECATTRYFLARAQWEAGGDRSEAVALARKALTVFERDARLEPWHHGRPAEIRAWLAKHAI